MTLNRTLRSFIRPLLTRPVERRRSLPFVRPSFEVLEDRVVPATFTVTSGSDAGPGSFRQAVLDANATPDADDIAFAAGVTTVGLTGPRVDITAPLAIRGAGPAATAVARTGGTGGLLNIPAGVAVQLSALMLRGGTEKNGGAVESRGNLTIDQAVFTANTATESGGGLFVNGGQVAVSNSTFFGNAAQSSSDGGGGIAYVSGAGASSLTLTNVTVSGNTAASSGGGVNLNVTDQATATFTNSTITANTTPFGGGGGVFTSARITLNNTLVAGNTTAGQPNDIFNFGATPVAGSNNLVGSGATAGGLLDGQNGNRTGVDPQVGPVKDNGGPVPTVALLAGSPAVDAGSNALLPAGLTTDARGRPRVLGGTVDIGATEGIAIALVVTSAADDGPGSLRQVIVAANAAGGGTITFDPAVSGQTITLTSDQIQVTTAINLTGPGARNLAIVPQGGQRRAFEVVTANGNLTLSGVTIRGGTAPFGAGVWNNGASLTVLDSVLSGNTSTSDGAAITSNGTLVIRNSTFSGNAAPLAGAVRVFAGSALIVNSTFSGNTATNNGFGAAVQINPNATAQLANVTVAGNIGGSAVFNAGNTTITNSILAGTTNPNVAAVDLQVQGGTLEVFSTLIQTGGPAANLAAGVRNNIFGVDPLLGPPADNGGPTPTMLPQVGSPAANAGSTDGTLLPAGTITDQRGQPRLFGNTPLDLGAVETDLPAPRPTSFTVAGVTVDTRNLTPTVVGATTVYTGTVQVGFAVANDVTNFTVNLGANGTSGLVVNTADSKALQFQAVVNGALNVRGFQLSSTNLAVSFDVNGNLLTITGGATASATAQGGDAVPLALTLGGSGTSGLLIRDGKLAQLDASLDGAFTVKSVAIVGTGLRLTYSAGDNTFNGSGGAGVNFTANGQQTGLTVQFGGNNTRGLVIQNGQIQELAGTVTGNFRVLGLDFQPDTLAVQYNREAGDFVLAGNVRVSTAQQGAARVFNNLAVQLGSSVSAPGIRVLNGVLTELDVRVNASINLFGLTVQADDLRVQFDRTTNAVQFTGAARVEVVNGTFAQVTLPNGGITVNTQSGEVNVGGLVIQVGKLRLGPIEVQDLFLSYANTNGSISVSGRGMVSLMNGRIVVAGNFDVVDGKLRNIGLSAEFNPGLPVVSGVLFLTRIGGQINNLDNPSQLQVSLDVSFSVGQRLRFGSTTVALAEISGRLSITTEQIEISGTVSVLGGLLGQAQGRVTFRYAEPQFVEVSGSFSAFFGVLNGQINFRVDTFGNVDAGVRFELRTPNFFPSILRSRLIGSAEGSLKIRPNSDDPNDNKIVLSTTFLRLRVSATLFLKDTPGNPGRRGIRLFVAIPIFPNIDRTWVLNDSGGRANDGTSLSDADVQSEGPGGIPGADPDAPAPTLTIDGASPNPNSPTGTVSFTPTTSTNAAGTTVTLFVDQDASGYDGRPISAALPYRQGSQSFTWADLADYAPVPFDANKPLFVYGLIDDGVNAPAYSKYSAPIVPPNTAPALAAPGRQTNRPGQPLMFSAAAGNAIMVTDPLPGGRVAVTLRVQNGVLTVGALPAGVTATSGSDDLLTVTGPSAGVTAALDGLTYTADSGEYFDDALIVSVSRTGVYPGGAATATVPLDSLPLFLSGPTDRPYTQGTDAAALLDGLILTNVGTDVINGATVRVIGFMPGLDRLACPDVPGIAVVCDPLTGVVTLIGSASVEEYQEVLRKITFSTAGGEDRDLLVTIGDQAGEMAEFTLNVRVTAVAQPPIIRQVASAGVYVPGGTPVALDRQLAVTYPTGRTLTEATVRFVEGFAAGQDVLTFAAQNGITGDFDPATGTLTLTGTASVAAYRTALRSITYSNTAAAPAEGPRTLAVTGLDGATASASALVRVLVSADPVSLRAPDVFLPTVAVTLPAGFRSVAVAPFSDVYSTGPMLTGATVAITAGFVVGEDYLEVTGTLPGGITASYDALTGWLTLAGVATASDYGLALQAVVYSSGGNIRTGDDRTIEVTVTDGLTVPDTAEVTVTVDAPPVLLTSAGVSEYFPGSGAAAVEPGLSVFYRGATVLTGATVRFTFGYQPAEDRLEFDTQNGITGSFDPATGVLTLTGAAGPAEYELALQSVRYRNLLINPTAGDRELIFAVSSDDAASDPETGRTLLGVQDGTTAAAVAVNAGPVSVAERSAAVPILPGLTLTDPDGKDPILFGAVVDFSNTYVRGEDLFTFTAGHGITGSFLPATGELVLTGQAPLSSYQAVLRTVAYRNLSAAPSVTPRNVTITLEDGLVGGRAVGTTTILPVSANDAPTRSAGVVADLNTATNAGIVSLGLGTLSYAPPAGITTLVYTVTQVPDSALGRVLLADGTAAVVGAAYGLAQLQGAKFAPASATVFGSGRFAFTVAGIDPATGRTDIAVLTETVNLTVTARPSGLAGTTLTAVGSAIGDTVRLLNPDRTVRVTATPFGAGFAGGIRTATADFNGDGVVDLVVGSGPGVASRVRVLDGTTGAELFSVSPFEEEFIGGVFVAAGDLDGDGIPELVVTPDQGGGPRVNVYKVACGKPTLVVSFFGIDDPAFRGGARVAIGDIDGDGKADLVVAAGVGGGPRVAVFGGLSVLAGNPTRLFADRFVFESDVRNGAYVAVGDIDGDGFAELLAGGGPGGGARVRVLSGKELLAEREAVLADFFAADLNDRNGATVAVKDLDRDGKADLVIGAGGRVRGYTGVKLTTGDFNPEFNDDGLGGIYVG